MRVYEVPHFHFGQGQIDGRRRPLPAGETRRVHLRAASARQEGLQEEERRRRGSGGEGPVRLLPRLGPQLGIELDDRSESSN